MQNIKMRAPEGVDKVSVSQQQFDADETGHIYAPPHFEADLARAGFRRVHNGEVAEPAPSPQASAPADKGVLLGSSKLPAEVEVGLPSTVPLGMIVAAAHKRSELSVEAWNALPDESRDAIVDREVAIHTDMNAQLKTLESQTPQQQRAWLEERGVKTTGVRNVDLLPLAARTINDAAGKD